MGTSTPADEPRWFAMRDLKRWNAILPAYKQLAESGFEVFTPMRLEIVSVRGRREKRMVPVLKDLLFVRSTVKELSPVVEMTPTLQFRFKKGGWKIPMTVSDTDMKRFQAAVGSVEDPKFYSPEQITPEMVGKRVKVIGGALDGYVARLRVMRGSKKRRLFVELPEFMAVEIEIDPEFIEVLDK